jgi:putative phage-type endonuclease
MSNNIQHDIILHGGFSTIKAEHFRAETLRKGSELTKHLYAVEEIRSKEQIFFKAKIVRTTCLNEAPYSITFELDQSRNFKDGRCNCVAGITANCKHSAALFLFINNERSTSQTDKEQQWKTPSKKIQVLYPKGETVEQLLGGKGDTKSQICVEKKSSESLSKLADELKQFGLTNSSLYKSLTVEKAQILSEETVLPQCDEAIKEIFFHPSDVILGSNSAHLSNFYMNNVHCSSQIAFDLFLSTFGQSKNKNWFSARKTRISASKAHLIANARKVETQLKYFFTNTVDNEHLRYGRETEAQAKIKYTGITRNDIHECGVVISTSHPWICASPDGLVKDPNGNLIVLEVKCPSSCKGQSINVPYLKNNELKINHQYYTQIQIQMFCCNAKYCHFFVFSKIDYRLLVIERDEKFL